MKRTVLFGGQHLVKNDASTTGAMFTSDGSSQSSHPSHAPLQSFYVHEGKTTYHTEANFAALYDTADNHPSHQHTTADVVTHYENQPVRMDDFVSDVPQCRQTCHEEFFTPSLKPMSDKNEPR